MLIQETKLNNLLSTWSRRLHSDNNQSEDYKCALGECIYDLQELLSQERDIDNIYFMQELAKQPPEEIKDYFLSQEADLQLAAEGTYSHAV